MNAPADAQVYDFTGMQALVVDDEPSMREIVKYVLQGMGFKTDTAESGQDGFAKVRSTYYDLVVSDLRMPNGDGAEFLDKIYQHKCKVGVFYFLSAYRDINLAEVQGKGAMDILSKPIDIKQFRAVIAQAVLASRTF